jgi:hypothetical protein
MAELEPDNSASAVSEPDNTVVSDVDERCVADGGCEVTQEDSEKSDKESQTVRSKHKFEVKVCHCGPNQITLPLCAPEKVEMRAGKGGR